MCEMCEYQFDVMSAQFDDTFSHYIKTHEAGQTRDTPAKRVHDLAFEHQELCATRRGQTVIAWYLAIAMERLTALQEAGVPT